MSIDDVINEMDWTPYREMPLKSGESKELRSCDHPTPAFWALWRERKADLKAAGYAVFNRTGEKGAWRVEQWVPRGKRPRVGGSPHSVIRAKRDFARPLQVSRRERDEFWRRNVNATFR